MLLVNLLIFLKAELKFIFSLLCETAELVLTLKILFMWCF